MMKRIFWVAVLLVRLVLGQADTVWVMTYNVLNFPGSNGNQRLGYFSTILQYVEPDVLLVQEVESQDGVNLLLSVLDTDFQAVPFHDGPDTDNALFYRASRFTFLGASYHSTALRDIAEYHLKHLASGEEMYCYSVHLKASQGTQNEQKRLAEATILKNSILALPPQANYIAVGDMNLYTSNEPAYQLLISDSTLFDPIDAPGNWHNNPAFADIHTQSPRANSFGGGSSGGLDDRFDFILISPTLLDNIISSGYHVVGNDGNHFNLSVNDGTNWVVPPSVADALYYASDHLPVVCPFVFEDVSTISHGAAPVPKTVVLLPNFPNPFNPGTTITFRLGSDAQVELAVYDIRGAKVAQLISGYRQAGTYRVNWQPSSAVPGGVYFVRLSTPGLTAVRKMVYVK